MSDLKIVDLYENSSDRKRQEFVKTNKTELRLDHNYEKNIIDDSWLKVIEDNIRYLDNILRNPNRFIVNEEEVVKIELARRITVDSIKHLSKNTSFIQDIDEESGDVKPAKILNINKEESYNTYENRVIYTLIKNLMLYIDLKKKSLNLSLSTKNDKNLTYQGAAKIGAEEVNIKMSLNSSIDDKAGLKEIEDRLQKIEFQIKDLTNTDVYRSIERERIALIRPPIKKTNLILKNTNFQKAMLLWNFLQEEMEDNSEIQKGSEHIVENEELQKLLDETFMLNYFILNSFDNDDSDEEKIKKTNEVIINNLIQKLVVTNEGLTANELSKMLDEQLQVVKSQSLANEEEILAIYRVALDEYLNEIEEVHLGDENEEN